MKINLQGIKKLFSFNATPTDDPNPESLDIREEYGNAFRTESYNDFWTHVLTLNKGRLATHRSLSSTSAARLPSYRLFAEQLLDPDQSTATRILGLTRAHPKIFSLLTEYFSLTSNASHLCGLLLKDIDRIRKRYKFSLETPLNPNSNGLGREISHLPLVLARITLLSRSNPFSTAAPSMSLIVAAHGFIMLVAGPGLVVGSLELISVDRLARWSAQLESAAKGTYILLRDLDTISRHVARLNNELEHVEGLVQMWSDRGDDRLGASDEVACQLKRNNQSFIEQLDELEEHLYLCFMTINRARNLVTKEILNSGC
ncbi:UPF0496 protein [Striga hermonthica]|uniref:UPF0496 protein n=1 Tax=Striga hermonthica TaxID=68872 RepID=A0A9N7RK37_STRHE|nr:UPF0496 protein [Striga hermonthica]